jgi:hypothetical protein
VESKIVNKSELFYETKYDNSNIGEYYQYILNSIILFLTENNVPYSINFGCDNKLKDINLDFQYEHTIINNGDGSYSCTVYRFEELIKLQSVFEYSNANINNIKTSEYFKKGSDVFRYYPPLIYDITNTNDISDRVKNCLTIHSSTPRRNDIHQKIDMDYFHNVCGGNVVYSKDIIKSVMDGYKVLVNIHQTDKYCTLEELRVLPALMTGILVISEDSPYKEHIPYNEHIIWSPYDKIVETINNVLDNYDFFRQKYLTNLNLTLKKMKDDSNNEMSLIFKNYIV